MKKSSSVLLKIVGAFLLICAFLVGWVVYDTHRYFEFHSAEHVPDLAHYVEYYGEPEEIQLVRVNQNPYYRLIPARGNFATLVSGPPVFLYDNKGELWDYNLNSGDANFEKGGFSMSIVKFEGEVDNPVQRIQKIMGDQK